MPSVFWIAMYNEKMNDEELWVKGDEELAAVLKTLKKQPDALWLCIGFGREEDVGKVPLVFYEDAPDLLKVRMN